MNKGYTIVIPGTQVSAIYCEDWDTVLAKTKDLCNARIKHYIRNNEFNTVVWMYESR